MLELAVEKCSSTSTVFKASLLQIKPIHESGPRKHDSLEQSKAYLILTTPF